ncbi:type I-E CRISPR-associated protein Cse1/CasA [Nocardiopsis sp. CNT-189]|uniref:type I-E CRISPR-associated protein Cse1/CasA n=1 Tax=Nocardiopsis oceanisediminis TaxID=2816862 RepID=UPI003B3176F5
MTVTVPTEAGLSFDLIDEPWLPCIGVDGRHRTASLREALTEAHEIRDLVVDVPTQYPALVRLLLAVLHRALGVKGGKQYASQPRNQVDWKLLYGWGRFPREPLDAYLDTWRHRFDLFAEERPFFQAADLAVKGRSDAEGGGAKPSNLLIPHAASGNNAPIFSAARDGRPVRLTPAEAARWLVHVHAWDTAGIKTGAIGDPKAKAGKTTGNRTGHLGSLGVLLPTGATLWETLMFNLLPLDDDVSPEDDLPFWEREEGLDSTWRERLPRGVIDLYCWPARRVRLRPGGARDGEGPSVRHVLVCAGDRLLDGSTLHSLEPHSAWWAVSKDDEKKEKRTEGMPEQYRSERHRPGRQLWRGLGGILGRKNELSGPKAYKRPLALENLAAAADGAVAGERVIQVRAFGTTYGIQSAVVEETYTDTLPLPVALLRPQGAHELDAVAVRCVEDSERAARALGRFAADIAFAAGGDGDAEKSRQAEAQNRLYLMLDHPFRDWIARLADGRAAEEHRGGWHRRVRTAAGRLAADLAASAPVTAERVRLRPPPGGKEGRPRPINLAIAWNDFTHRLHQAVPQAGRGSGDDENGGPR